MRPVGPVAIDLAQELDDMEALFCGAYLTVCREIGMEPDGPFLL
jgi:hypothetical protein